MNFSEINELELLELLLEEEGIELTSKQSPILRRGLTRTPASFQQRRLWFLYELEPTSSAYNICSIFRLDGSLQIQALKQAFEQLQQRHESLRTTFVAIDGEPWQHIHPEVLSELEIENWSELPADEIEKQISIIKASEAGYSFDLQAGPLFRAKLLQLESEKHLLSLTLHHIIADGWSIGIILEELASLYESILKKDKSSLPELRIQYPDYSIWQQEKIADSVWEEHLVYWEKQLAQLPILQFPTDFPRPALQSFQGDLVEFSIAPELTNAIRSFNQEENVTLFTTLMAAFQTFLARYSGQEDITVGTSIANRPGIDTERLIGFFVNTLVIRTDLSREPSFRTLVSRVKKTVLEAFERSEVTFETLVDRLQVERDTSRNPLFQIAFTLLNAPKPKFTQGNLEISSIGSQNAARFDLELFVIEAEDSLKAVLSYNINLFTQETAARFARHFCELLKNLVAQPDTPTCHLPILLSEEYKQLISSAPRENFPVDYCLHQAFSQQVNLHPDHQAVSFGHQSLTYKQLNERANQLALDLIDHGAKAELRVGLLVNRSLEMVIGILAILKAGAAYVPIDPQSPQERIAYILEDSGVSFLLTQVEFASQLSSQKTPMILLENCQQEISKQKTTDPEIAISPDNAAYVIYTSGSTGKPKGVIVTHRNVVRLMLATQKWYNFNNKDVWTLFHSCAFDFSVWEIWGALFFGGHLIIVPHSVTRSPEEFYNLLCDEGVTVLNQTPSAFCQLIQAEEVLCRESEVNLRYVIFGGEALDLSSLEPWFERHSDDFPRLVNMYGITETTVHVTYRPIRWRDVKKARGSIIGEPIPDLYLYLLDRYGQPVATGVTGEIYVGGAGVARGYLNRPDLTAERMVPNPASSEDQDRLYRTGDLARYLANGELEYLGRNDHQVKIRGFRIELEEIEAVLQTHPGVRHSCVIPWEQHQDDVRAIAYIVPQTDTAKIPEYENLITEQIQEWQYTFNETYRSRETEIDAAFHIAGWNSSYDGKAIPVREMRQWLDNTLAQIRSLKPIKVLEIGCGTGMILLNIAAEVDSYWATDFSSEAINRLQKILHQGQWNQVRLQQQEANNFTGLPQSYFDTIIINSVAQYFPSLKYLQQVIAGSLDLLAPGGSLFIGDNRHLLLLDCFYASVAFEQEADDTNREDFKQKVRLIAENENELTLDPIFFADLPRTFPAIAGVEIYLKREKTNNEMTKYRYDIVLHKQGERKNNKNVINPIWFDWQPQNCRLSDVHDQLRRTEGDRLSKGQNFAIGWRGIPNAQLVRDEKICHWYRDLEDCATVGELRNLFDRDTNIGVVPGDFHDLAMEIGYEVIITYSADGDPSHFDVCFYTTLNELEKRRCPIIMPLVTRNSGDCSNYYLNPLKGRFAKALIDGLKERASKQLPEYMRPGAYMLLDRLPITSNGKLDRRSLPLPTPTRTIARKSFVEPQTSTQNRLCLLWNDVLGLDHLGITDNFFQLGGHSLLATKLVSRIREQFDIALPLRAIFEHPTVIELAEEIDKLLSQSDQDDNLAKDAILPLKNRHNLCLSFAQQRLWFLDQLEPDNPAYNIVVGFRLNGILHEPAVAASLQEIVTRHEVLRTTFAQDDQGNPVQVIDLSATIALNITDLTHLLESEREEKLKQAVNHTVLTPFNLKTGPLLRVYLYRLDQQAHVLVAVMHHIVSDAWSFGIVVKELSLLYEAFCQGNKSPLLPLTLQYADFAFWQRTFFEREELPKQLVYWQQELSGEIQPLNLPIDFPRPAIATHEGRAVSFTIDRDHYLRFKQLCESHGATLFMGLLTVLKVLLMRYSGQDDILVGTPIANRNRREIEDIMGFFVNTLVIRTDLSSNPSFATLLEKIKDKTLQAYVHQDLPFEKLVETLQPERNLSHSPLFEVMFVLQNAPMSNLELTNLEFTPLELEQVTAKFELTLSITETETGLQGLWEYKTDLFEESTISRMIGHFQTLLSGAIDTPELGICQLPLLSSLERHQLLVGWNQTHVEYPRNKCIHQLFEQQVENTPEAIAVLFENEQLTYHQLNQRANQLAHYLRSLGVKPEMLVGICVERSIEMVVGLLGILKAGGAYVPLDPAYPAERLANMVADAEISVLLMQNKWTSQLLEHQPQVICLDSDWEKIGLYSQENPTETNTGENLAYVIYTSGSTGKSKGVLVTHQNLLQSTNARISYYNEPPASFLLLSSFAFDSSVAGIFWTLCQGGSLVLPPQNFQEEPQKLTKLITENKISHLLSLPSLYALILSQSEPEQLVWLRTVIVAGEPCPAALVKLHNQRLGHTSLFNEYGPTEATVWSSVYKCQSQEQIKLVPIGRPIANTQAYILDRYLQPVPIGVLGELYIGGDGLAKGYLNRSELTQEKFITNPFSDSGSKRLYKTGDLARYLSDGNIEFIGRIDNQVKIRGFRIELGEIESALSSHEQVQQCVVIAREDNPSNKHLVAYVVTDDDINISALKEHLKQQLPNYMVPSIFVRLETLPLTTNGKVNRKALPAPTLNKFVHSGNCILPRTALEHQLAKIWEAALEISPISVTDNFFELGGHSLLAIGLITEIEKQLGSTLPVLSFFREGTIEKMALYLENNRESADSDILLTLQKKGNQTPLFLVHPAGGYGLVYSFLANKLGTNQPVYALQSQGLDGKQQPLNSIESMASTYIKAIREIQAAGAYLIGGYSLGGLIAFEIASQLEAAGESVENLLIIDAHPPLPDSKTETILDDDIASLIIFVEKVGLHFNAKIKLNYEYLSVLDEVQKLEYVLQILQHHQLVPPNSGKNLISGSVNVFKANSQAIHSYQPKAINAPISLFKTEVLAKQFPNNSTLGWDELTSQQVYIRTVKGIHESLLQEPSVSELSAAIQEIL